MIEIPDSKELDNILKEVKNRGDDKLQNTKQNKQNKKNKKNKSSQGKANNPVDENLKKIIVDDEPEYEEYEEFDMADSTNNSKKIIIAVVAIVAIIVIIGAVLFANKSKEEAPQTTAPVGTSQSTTVAPVSVKNPLTNKGGYNQKAANKRPVAIVVENAMQARPQWGIDDKKNSPDIIVEGEVEGGETRMLWLYADYTAVPDQIGPIRSARPPFIKFSEMFDSIFIHWGESSSKGDYVGANTIFKQDDVDHINQMEFSDKVGLFSRNKSRNVSSEHTGVVNGAKVADAIAQKGFRTDANNSNYTKFSFNDKDKTVSENKCSLIDVRFSSRSKTRTWSYSADDKMYHSNDYKTDVARKNLLVLFDSTSYVVKSNYKGSGRSETYCNYNLNGGTGKLATMGTVVDIKWSVENNQLVIKDTNGKVMNLNTGTTWIGWASSNNGGKTTA